MKSAVDVARYFLCHVDREAGDTISPLKLQKLVYYAQAWSLVFRSQPLFDINQYRASSLSLMTVALIGSPLTLIEFLNALRLANRCSFVSGGTTRAITLPSCTIVTSSPKATFSKIACRLCLASSTLIAGISLVF